MKPLTIEQARKLRSTNRPEVIYPVYNVETGELISVYRYCKYSSKLADTKKEYKSVNVSNKIHCPRDIYLKLTPMTQLDFYLDGYLTDEITERHKMLREKLKYK